MRMVQVDTTPAMISVSRFLLVLILDIILLMPGIRSIGTLWVGVLEQRLSEMSTYSRCLQLADSLRA